MSKAIWKFEIQGPQVEIFMPIGAQILALQTQVSRPCLWALVDTEAAVEMRLFVTIGTGRHIYEPEKLTYVGTFQIAEGTLVFHVFELLQSGV